MSDAGGNYPGRENIVRSNKPALPAGKGEWSPGSLVYLHGRVLDEDCVPVSDAVVDIWQTNTYGEYRKIEPAEMVNPYPIFAGSGRAITDSFGRYSFITVFPGPYGKRAPHIHVRVTHEDFPTLTTEIFFMGDRRNNEDPKLSSLPKGKRKLLEAKVWVRNPGYPEDGINGYFDIVLEGRNMFRSF